MTLGQGITHRGTKIHVGMRTPWFIRKNSAAFKFQYIFTIQQEVQDQMLLCYNALWYNLMLRAK